jgi:nucleotide-binding universal stress UspA family protein
MAVARKPVVVGVDGSERSLMAASWGAAEASRRQLPVHLVLVNDDPARADYAENAVHNAGQRCRKAAPEVDVTEDVAPGHPVEDLVRRSRSAEMIVVGSRGHGQFADALLGSVSTSVATHSACPVVVIRGAAPTTGPVVVGVDNSPGSRAALQFAFEAAALRGTELMAVQAWEDITAEYPFATALPWPGRAETQQRAECALAEQLAGWSEKYPEVLVRRVAQRDHPVAALTDLARHGQLLVVGHRGRGGFGKLLLGSVASGVLHHSPCPTAIVRTQS